MVNEDQKRLFVNEGHPLLLKSWVLHKQHSQIAEQSIGLPKLQATLLSNRDVKTSLEAIDFLASDERLSSDPKLLPNIDKGVELVSDRITKQPFPTDSNVGHKIEHTAIKKGLLVLAGVPGLVQGVGGDHIELVPPYVIDDTHVEFITTTLRESILEVCENA